MLKRQYLNDIFRSGRLYAQPALKDLIEDIVHSSIMRLGHESLQKLYDLMVMSVKFQILSTCDAPSLLAITATHIESWSSLTADPELLLQVQHAKNLLTTVFKLQRDDCYGITDKLTFKTLALRKTVPMGLVKYPVHFAKLLARIQDACYYLPDKRATTSNRIFPFGLK